MLPFGLLISQAKYFYNLLYFFHYQNFGLADSPEALNFRVPLNPYVFLALVRFLLPASCTASSDILFGWFRLCWACATRQCVWLRLYVPFRWIQINSVQIF